MGGGVLAGSFTPNSKFERLSKIERPDESDSGFMDENQWQREIKSYLICLNIWRQHKAKDSISKQCMYTNLYTGFLFIHSFKNWRGRSIFIYFYFTIWANVHHIWYILNNYNNILKNNAEINFSIWYTCQAYPFVRHIKIHKNIKYKLITLKQRKNTRKNSCTKEIEARQRTTRPHPPKWNVSVQ